MTTRRIDRGLEGVRALLRHRGAVAGLAFGAYLAYALFITWPWVTDPSGILYGVIGGDLTSGVAEMQQLAEDRQAPFLPGETTQVNAPEGYPTNWSVHLASFGSSATRWGLSLMFGSVAAHGLLAVLGFTLSAFAMFLLARAVTGHAGAAFVAGLAFGFWPFMYGTGWTWPHYIHLWVFVLLAWRMLVAVEKPSLRNGLLAGAAAVLAMTWIQYNLLIAGVVFATLAGVALVRAALRHELRPQIAAQAVAGAVVLVAVVGIFVAGLASGFSGIPTRSEGQSTAGSARFEMYSVPGPRHPILGDETGPWLFERFAGPIPDPPPGQAIYAEIYLGIPIILLGLIGGAWAVARVRRNPREELRRGLAPAGFTALVLGIVGLAFSAPPRAELLGLSIPMPYLLIEQLTTVFRVAHRFAIVVMLASCLLTALALSVFLRGRAIAAQAAVLAVLAVVFAVDLRAQPTPRTTRVQHPKVHDLLAQQPPGIVAEYPLNLEPTVHALQSLFQDAHEHPLFAGAPARSEDESRKLELQFLDEKRTVPELAAYGVKYVVVHHGQDVKPQRGQRVPGLELIGRTKDSSLFRVDALPARFTAYGIHGFYLTEPPSPGSRWMTQNGAEIELRGRCDPCVGLVELPAAAFAKTHVLAIEDEQGNNLFYGIIDTMPDKARFRVRFSRRMVLRLTTNPKPAPINEVIPGPDYRPVSISIMQPITFTPDPRRGHRPLG